MNISALTADNVGDLLAAESVRGPRSFRGRPLADSTRGLRIMRQQVIRQGDPTPLYDAAYLHLLSQAYGATEEEKRSARIELQAQVDNPAAFRGMISLQIDTFSDADHAEAERLVNELLDLEKAAEAKPLPDPKKNAAGAVAETPPIQTPSPSTSSPAPPDGASSSSAGS